MTRVRRVVARRWISCWSLCCPSSNSQPHVAFFVKPSSSLPITGRGKWWLGVGYRIIPYIPPFCCPLSLGVFADPFTAWDFWCSSLLRKTRSRRKVVQDGVLEEEGGGQRGSGTEPVLGCPVRWKDSGHCTLERNRFCGVQREGVFGSASRGWLEYLNDGWVGWSRVIKMGLARGGRYGA
ncbi:hypothetical protein FN846DRAFT_122984 [Sphaerosporella brunnea]|uniref:Uncharacterized protein n=1 Tax=Sphaerosporella brunnea TaxID=1250544 RepID=A0A5J5ESJ3_9PEZI|nr:hypothetical protein FN846DRAFT_122984 [Sphaerosporella brunnea]